MAVRNKKTTRYECEAHNIIRLELPRDISKHQQQAVTRKERMVGER